MINRLFALASLLGLLGVAPLALAQDAPGEESAPLPEATPAPEDGYVDFGNAEAAPAPMAPADGDGGEFRLNEAVNLPPDEMLASARELMEEMRGALSRALEILTKARESKDVIRLNCVNDKLTPMKGILKIADDSMIAMQEAIAVGNLTAAGNEYTKIKVGHEKVSTLLVQAINCVGAESTYDGDTDVQVDVDEDAVGGDPYYGDPEILVDPADITVDGDPDEIEIYEETPVLERLPPASPFN